MGFLLPQKSGAPNTDCLIFFAVSLLSLLFISSIVLQWAARQVSHSYEKADCHIGLTGPFEEELQKLHILLFYPLNSNKLLPYKTCKMWLPLKLIYIILWAYSLVFLVPSPSPSKNVSPPPFSLLLHSFLGAKECLNRWRTRGFSVQKQ